MSSEQKITKVEVNDESKDLKLRELAEIKYGGDSTPNWEQPDVADILSDERQEPPMI